LGEYFTEEEILVICYQISKALEFLYENHILHYDLKPENILYSSTNKSFKVCDFGMSVDESSMPGYYKGGT